MELILEVLFWPFVACLVLTGIHTYLGLHVVSRGVIFVDLALAQIAALGATFAFLLGFAPDSTQAYLYSLLFAFTGAAIFSVSRLREQRIPQEAIIGITFVVASSAAILIADRAPQGAEFVAAMLTGALLWVPREKILETALIYAGVGLFHWFFRDRFLTISLEPERAEAEGINVRWWDFLFYASFGFVITYSVPIAGVLLVFSFLVIPSVIAMLFSGNIGSRLAIGWTTGALVSMVGLSASYFYDFPSGPAVVCTFGGALALAAVVRYLMATASVPSAIAKVAATIAVVAAGLWLAFYGASGSDEPPPGSSEAASGAADSDPRARALEALRRLEASPDDPPAAAVEELLAVGQDLHLMMGTGDVNVSETAVQALANAPQDGRVMELLEEIAYHANDPWARLRGAEVLLERRNPLGIEPLLELMEHDQPLLVQLETAQLLRDATGQNFGYDAEADPETKREAVARWREWWEANRSAPLRN